MRVSRSPEHRGGAGSPVLIVVFLIALLIVGGVVIYLLLGNNAPGPAPVVPPPAPITQVPSPQTAPLQEFPTLAPPVSQPDVMSPTGSDVKYPVPEVSYGEVLAEDFVDLQLLAGSVRTWFTFQVDTSTQDITLFFALYSVDGTAITRAVKIDDYSQGNLIDNAEITLFYPDAPERVLSISREEGTMISQQSYHFQPYEPSLFSPTLRLSLIEQDLILANGAGDIQVNLQLDRTGIFDREGIAVQQTDQVAVDVALDELQLIVDQIESRRPRS